MNFGFEDHLSRRGGELTTRPSQIKYHASEIMDGSFGVLSIRVERRHVGANRTRAWFVAARLSRKRSTLGETLRPAAKPPHPACGVSQTRVVLVSEIKSDADVFREVSATLGLAAAYQWPSAVRQFRRDGLDPEVDVHCRFAAY